MAGLSTHVTTVVSLLLTGLVALHGTIHAHPTMTRLLTVVVFTGETFTTSHTARYVRYVAGNVVPELVLHGGRERQRERGGGERERGEKELPSIQRQLKRAGINNRCTLYLMAVRQ